MGMAGNRIGPWRFVTTSLAVALATLAASGLVARAPKEGANAASDPLAAEIGGWSTFLQTNDSKDEDWKQVKQIAEPVLAAADQALHAGRRLLALQKLSAVRPMLAASVYLNERSASERKEAGFEVEWVRMGKVLRSDLTATSPRAFDGVKPAAVRAFAEAALPQVRVFYDASLEYGRNTMPESGLFYLGSARAQREFADFCRKLSTPSPLPAPKLRPLTVELDRLEGALLSAYRPPASIDRHSEFIGSSAALKEAREIDRDGLRYGALLKYLQAVLRAAPLTPTSKPLDGPALTERLRDFDTRLSAEGVDHSIGRIFLETAQADLASPASGSSPTTAAAIAAGVLPRYFAALEPAAPRPSRPAGATVTLVRWPYT